MGISTFFKLLKRKINHYDKIASNPFAIPQTVTIIWVECEKSSQNSSPKKFGLFGTKE